MCYGLFINYCYLCECIVKNIGVGMCTPAIIAEKHA